MSGITGTLPNTTYSSSISLAEVTGIGARRVGVIIGAIFLVVAFFPKVAALLIAIPAPVAAAYLTVLLGLLFVQGMRIVIQDGVDHRKAAVAGLAFWIGVGFQNQWVFPDLLGEGFLGILLGNGMTSGALVAVIMMVFLELTGPQAQAPGDPVRRRCPAQVGRVPSRLRVKGPVGPRFDRTLGPGRRGDPGKPVFEEVGPRRLVVTARTDRGGAELEFVSGTEGENLEDRLSYLEKRRTYRTAGTYRSACCATTHRPCGIRSITAWTSLP